MAEAEQQAIDTGNGLWTRIREGFAHHLDAWRTAWAMDKDNTGPRRSRTDAEFLPAALEVMESPASPVGRLVLWTIMGFFVITVAWATFSQIEINATTSGKIIPAGRVKVIQSEDTGTVSAILVAEGQRVQEGDLLIELDATQIDAERQQLEREMQVAQIDMARWQAVLDNPADPVAAFTPPSGLSEARRATYTNLLRSQTEAIRSRLSSIDNQIKAAEARLAATRENMARMTASLPLLQRELDAKRTLVDKGVAARLSVGPLERQVIDFKMGITGESKKVEEALASIAAARAQRNEVLASFENNALSEFTLSDRRIHNFKLELVKLERRRTQQALIAPVGGIVQQLKANTIGGVVTPAEPLMLIVPDSGALEAEVMITRRDIGFLQEGMPAVVKLETFLFTRYGTINGTVRSISPDAITDERLGLVYAARIALDSTEMLVDGRQVQLSPGMAVTVEVKTGHRRIIEFVLAPLLRYSQESLRER